MIMWMLVVVLVIYAAMIFFVQHWTFFHFLFITILLVLWVMVSLFFRIPRRIFTSDDKRLIAPADGTVVTIEETYEKEYIKSDCIQSQVECAQRALFHRPPSG